MMVILFKRFSSLHRWKNLKLRGKTGYNTLTTKTILCCVHLFMYIIYNSFV